jgi:hypothetical protein
VGVGFWKNRGVAVRFRRVAVFEPAVVFGLIMAYIWDLRSSHSHTWLAILGLMALSHSLRHERAETLGFAVRNLRECWLEFAPALALLTLFVLGFGLLLGTIRPMDFSDEFGAWAIYLPWGLLQQYVLNGYFLNRFNSLLSRRGAPMMASALFAGAHTPNWFLMAVTLVAGYCSARIYQRYRNLYFLGIAHATVGFLLFLVVPDSISHHLRVGPGWFHR